MFCLSHPVTFAFELRKTLSCRSKVSAKDILVLKLTSSHINSITNSLEEDDHLENAIIFFWQQERRSTSVLLLFVIDCWSPPKLRQIWYCDASRRRVWHQLSKSYDSSINKGKWFQLFLQVFCQLGNVMWVIDSSTRWCMVVIIVIKCFSWW